MNIYDRIRLLWDSVKTVAHQSPGDEGRSQERQQDPPFVIRSELYIPEAVIERYDTRQKEENEDKIWRRRFEIGSFVTAVVGFLILLATLCETRRATNALVESSHLDKRAWAGIGGIQVLGTPEVGKPMTIKIGLKNSGESPAVHLFTAARLGVMKKAKGDIRLPFGEHQDLLSCKKPKPEWENIVGGAIVIPGSDAMDITESSEPLPEKYIAIMKPGQTIKIPFSDSEAVREFAAIPTAPGTPPETVDWAIGLYLVGCINYFDVFHEARRTSFCYAYSYDPGLGAFQPNGGFEVCPQGNDAD